MWFRMKRLYPFYNAFWISTRVVYYLQRYFCYMADVTWNLLLSRRTFCVHRTIMHQFVMSRRCVCLAVTWHLHFRQNGRDLLRANTVTWGWNRFQNKSQHRKLTLEKKILPQFVLGLELATFRSRVQRSSTELSLLHKLIGFDLHLYCKKHKVYCNYQLILKLSCMLVTLVWGPWKSPCPVEVSVNILEFSSKNVNMVLTVHRNHEAYWGRGEGGRGMEVGEEGDYVPMATLSPPQWLLH